MHTWQSILVVNASGEEMQIKGPPEYIQRMQHDAAFLHEQIQLRNDKTYGFNLILQDSKNLSRSQSRSVLEYTNECGHTEVTEDQDVTKDKEPTVVSEVHWDSIEDGDAMQRDGELHTWNDASTKLLISVYNELQPKLGKTFQLKTKKKLWETIMTKMHQFNYKFTSVQIENRWKTLERAFKKKTENNKKTGRNKVNCPYEKDLEECLIKKTSVVPEYLLNSSDSGKNRNDILQAAGLGQEVSEEGAVDEHQEQNEAETPSNISTPTSVIKKRDSATKELKELRILKEKYYEENVNLKKRKLEAYEKRTEEISRKNQLLQKFLDTLADK